MARIVLDANVIVSAAFGGIPLKALVKAFSHNLLVSPVIKQELLSLPEELVAKLSPDRAAKLRRWLKILLYKAQVCDPDKKVSLCRDPKDDAYLSLCLSAEIDYLVTGDSDLLSISKKQLSHVGLLRLQIVTPRRFLSAISGRFVNLMR